MTLKVTQEEVEAIVALDSDPVQRNYRITQAYADISRDFRNVVGPREANWCTFATWASATAGDFIRGDLFPGFLLGKLACDATFSHRLAALMAQTSPKRMLGHGGMRDIVCRVAEGVALQIAEGNLKVFAELAPAFVAFNELYDGPENPTPDAVRAHLEKVLRQGPSQEDGQSRLIDAFHAYAMAAVEQDDYKRSQLMLFGSVMIGFHEQIRLQPAIAGGLDAPFYIAVDEVIDLLATWAIVPPAQRWVARVLRGAVEGSSHGWVRTCNNIYRDAVTLAAMSLRLPERNVDLSRDVQYCPDGLPPAVRAESIVRTAPDLALLMEGFGMLSNGEEDSGARDWTRMTDRMPFILDLFRASQHLESLFSEPLEEHERSTLSPLTGASKDTTQTSVGPRKRKKAKSPMVA